MRTHSSRVVRAVVVAAVAAFATATAFAQIPIQPVKPVPPPQPSITPRIDLPPYIAGVRRTPNKGLTLALYSDGTISYDVEVVNPTAAALATQLIVERLGTGAATNPEVARVPVSVAAGERSWISFSDGLGLRNGCNATQNRLALETGTSSKTMRVVPSCSFSVDTNDPMASLVADRRLEAIRDRLTYHSATLMTPTLACGSPLGIRAAVRNNTPRAVEGARLRIDGPRVAAGEPFDLGPSKERVTTTTLAGFSGEAGAYTLKIDPARGAEVHQPGWSARVTRACRLEVILER